ncbi:MAG: hypothetical protein LLG09_02955 [Negativicutes bacterium]|nr:hypothetical protein [Negativicutes bacterium]
MQLVLLFRGEKSDKRQSWSALPARSGAEDKFAVILFHFQFLFQWNSWSGLPE